MKDCPSCLHFLPYFLPFVYPHNQKLSEGLARCAASVVILNPLDQHRPAPVLLPGTALGRVRAGGEEV
jgi:hypothetical protein